MYNTYSIIDGAIDQEASFDNYDDALEYASKLEREYRADTERDYEATIHVNETVFQNLLVDITIEKA